MNFFITGTDTNVGKSVLSLGLMRYLFGKGYAPRYFKPFQTGRKDAPLGDAGFIYKNIAQLKSRDPREAILYNFYEPLAPLFAAAREKQKIEAGEFDKKIAELSAQNGPLVVEGSGGPLVPVTGTATVLDFIGRIPRVKVLVAARCGLGTINHTLLTVGALERRGLSVAGIVLLNSAGPGSGPDREEVKENIRAIESFSSRKVLGVIPWLSDLNKELGQHLHIFGNLQVE